VPIAASTFEDLRKYLIEAATVAGLRFLQGDIKPGTKKTMAGWHDAWFDNSIPGYFKLNCFFDVPGTLYQTVKTTSWSPYSGKICFKPASYRKDLGRYDKGVDGTVICNGGANPASMEIMAVIGTDLKNEHFETALYENRLYKTPTLNLEFKLQSDNVGNSGKPETFAINAHVSKD